MKRDFLEKNNLLDGYIVLFVREKADIGNIRAPTEDYLPPFEAEKGDIGPENTCFGNIID
jgi:hypothetical protein